MQKYDEPRAVQSWTPAKLVRTPSSDPESRSHAVTAANSVPCKIFQNDHTLTGTPLGEAVGRVSVPSLGLRSTPN
jgi:hypothetical protein